MTSLNQFITEMKTRGMAKPCYFVVFLGIPPALRGLGFDDELLGLYCNSASLPGIQFETQYIKDISTPTPRVTGVNYGSMNLSFYVDQDMNLKRYFDMWSALIYDINNNVYNYKKDYVADSYVLQFANDGYSTTYAVKAFNAFPTSVSEMQLSYNAGDQVHLLNITLNYDYWVSDVQDQNKSDVGQCKMTLAELQNAYGSGAGGLGLNVSSILSGNFKSVLTTNNWVQNTFNTAGQIYSAYRGIKNTVEDISGFGKSVSGTIGAMKKNPSPDTILNGIGAIGRNIQNNPLARLIGTQGANIDPRTQRPYNPFDSNGASSSNSRYSTSNGASDVGGIFNRNSPLAVGASSLNNQLGENGILSTAQNALSHLKNTMFDTNNPESE